ncbi:bilin binding protein 1 [Danaus plexippus plexippus]|uniref:Bilin binding protein 1 n=1 Tax=Danaus plexippus plexippus TaxID=278856 RepID=A0A212ESV2_DANPL|nr:bilin binding protein 1 [Danaus plexippus plexippus]
MYTLLLLTLFSTAYANVFFDSKCPEVKSAENFEFSKFGKGDWYEIARYPIDLEKDSKCVKVIYTWMDDHAMVKCILMVNDKQVELNGIMRPVVKAGNTEKLFCSVSNENVKLETDVYILDIDYDNYAIAYGCKYDEEKKSRQDFAWIMSRSNTLSPAIKAKVENFVKESEFLYNDKFFWPETSCVAN